MKRTVLLCSCACISLFCFAQNSFIDASSLLYYPATRSGSPIGAADMNGDGLDDVVRLHQATTFRIDYQPLSGTFTGYEFGNLMGSGKEWGMAVSDVDENGFNDMIAGGAYNGLKRLLANSTGTLYTQGTLPNAPVFPNYNGIFLQSSNFADINNDGAIDYFGCHDDGLAAPYRGSSNGTFVWDTTLINPHSTIPSDNSGNYGSVWTDYDWDGDLDLYITKCRGNATDTLDGRRLNLMFENDGTNEFNEVAEEIGLRPFSQSWATDFGDLDNDRDMDAFIIKHDVPGEFDSPALYLNDDTDHYASINDSAGITDDVNATNQGIQIIMEDFDNDGLLDILLANVSGGSHRLFWNLGDMQFDHVTNLFPSGMPAIHSAAVGDFNHDGFMDIIAGHGSGYNNPSTSTNSIYNDDLLINSGNDNHFISIRTVGDGSHINGIGARLELRSTLGTQLREIRSGESYGIMNSLNAHFGLGDDTMVDSLVILWPSGEVDEFRNLRADQFMTIHEGIGPCDCNAPGVQTITELTGEGPGSLPYVLQHACPCDTLEFDESLSYDTLVLDEKLMIAKDFVLKGISPAKSRIATTTNTPAIRIQPGVHCTIVNLTISDDASMPPAYLIENLGTLTLSNVVIETATGQPLRLRIGEVTTGPGDVIIK